MLMAVTAYVFLVAIAVQHALPTSEYSYLYNQHYTDIETYVMFWPFDPAKNAIQGDAPEGSDTF